MFPHFYKLCLGNIKYSIYCILLFHSYINNCTNQPYSICHGLCKSSFKPLKYLILFSNDFQCFPID